MISKIFVLIIRFYQRAISPFLGSNCRFTPTCSEYAVEVLSDRPFYKAFYLIIRRVLRCHPFCEGGVDLPPPPGT